MSMAGFHITADCAAVYLQNESGTEFLQLARRLHDYLRQGQHLPVRSIFEATDGCKEISREAFDTLAKRRMENTGEVSGVFELDFDARTILALNIMDGWKVYAMQDVANAAEQAFQEAEISEDDRCLLYTSHEHQRPPRRRSQREDPRAAEHTQRTGGRGTAGNELP